MRRLPRKTGSDDARHPGRFRIAAEEFRLRGGGDRLRTRQSGLPGWRIADPALDEGLLRMANRDADLPAAEGRASDPRAGAGGTDAVAAVRSDPAFRTLHSG